MYASLSVGAGIRGSWWGRDAAVDVRVRDATGESYRDFLSRYKAFALNPGRDVVARLRVAS